jgi:hypothetical protein
VQVTPGAATTSGIGGVPSTTGEETESPGSRGVKPDDTALFSQISSGFLFEDVF